jgi:hypothetical protein
MKGDSSLDPAAAVGLTGCRDHETLVLGGAAFSSAPALIGSRRKVSAKRLVEPGPSGRPLEALPSPAARGA